MKCEFVHDLADVSRLTVIFESRDDMEKFKEVYDKFAALLPAKPAKTLAPDQSSGEHRE